MQVLGISGSLRRDSHNTRLLRAAAAKLPPGARIVVFEELAAVPPFDEDAEHGPAPAAVQRLLALSNVRLGTWLPNPAFLAVLGRPKVSWRTPRLPNARRLPYQLREIIGGERYG